MPNLTPTLVALIALAAPAAAQVDTTEVPRPPKAELARLDRFLGSYEHVGQFYTGVGPFAGTLVVRPAIRGWYVEWIIETRHGPIDRELRMLTTWDERAKHYRTWRFETLPQSPTGTVEAKSWFEGSEFVMEWPDAEGPNGEHGPFRNRIRLDGPDELVIVSEAEPAPGKTVRLGVWRNRRMTSR
ncbi:MAG: hypothetical protein AB7R55_19660 [Gemmatimonadales bacterium]